MSEQRYDILFAGELLPGFSADTVRDNLARLFKAPPETIARLMAGGTHTVKKNADEATAFKYRDAMQRAGAKAELRAAADAAATPSPAPSEALSMAPPGTDVLAEHERRHIEAVSVDTSHIKLASVFAAATVDDRPPPPIPDISHLSVAAVGADLLPDRDATRAPPPPDTSGISLAAPGERLGPENAAEPAIIPDTSGITLAPPGTPLDEIRPQRKPVNPDISALKLEP